MTMSGNGIPALTRSQVSEVDRLAADKFRVPVSWLMEAAGWQIARHCRGRTAVVCGTGNNGGDGLAAARHLHRWGRLHSICVTDLTRLTDAARLEADILEAVGVRIETGPRFDGAQLVLDAIFGTGLTTPPRAPGADWIRLINSAGRRVVSADIPSGLDSDDGRVHGEVVLANVTVTLGLPKRGLLVGEGPAAAGAVWLADIGIPLAAYAMVGAQVPAHLFAMHDRVELASLSL